MNKQHIKTGVTSVLVGVLAPLALIVPSVSAATVTWTGATDDKFNTSTNWAGGVVPGNTDTVEFPASGFASETDNDISSLSLASILFNGSNSGTSSWNYKIVGNGITITSGIDAVMTGSAGDQTVAVDITLGADATFRTTGANSLTIGDGYSSGSKGGGGAVNTLDLGSNNLTLDASGGSISIIGIIEGSGNIIKTGAGKISTLATMDSYTGAVDITEGVFETTSNTEGNIVINGGTLKGVSSLLGTVTLNSGSIAPGLSPGCLGTGDLTLAGGSFDVEIEGTTVCTEYDQVRVVGAVDLGSSTTLNVQRLASFDPAVNDTFAIITNDGTDAVSGTFNGLANGDEFTVDGYTYQINYDAGDGNDVLLLVKYTPSAPDTGIVSVLTSPLLILVAAVAALGTVGGLRYVENKRK